ncbi:MAG: MraY family glycosyltransferase [Alphaproteobacteria bacterium]
MFSDSANDFALAGVLGAILTLAAVLVAVPLLSLIGTRLAIPLLRRIGADDRPNERSSHDRPVPRGGGIVPVVLVALVIALVEAPGAFQPSGVTAAIMAVVLAAVGLGDDLVRLPPWPRLAIQAVAVGAGLAVLPSDVLVFHGLLGLPADRVLAGVLWLWFVNLYNFMDGIDGLAAGQTVVTGAGLGLVLLVLGSSQLGASRLDDWMFTVAVALAAAAFGFLRWNWPPASVFLGDAGSVPLGYLAGWLLLLTAAHGPAAHGSWSAAVILPLYFVADATTTLAARVGRGRAPWRAHRDHAYQIAARGRSHAWVTGRVLLLDLWLVALAITAALSPDGPWPVLGLALVSVAATLWYFRRQRPR